MPKKRHHQLFSKPPSTTPSAFANTSRAVQDGNGKLCGFFCHCCCTEFVFLIMLPLLFCCFVVLLRLYTAALQRAAALMDCSLLSIKPFW
jgi:hypothetical protein